MPLTDISTRPSLDGTAVTVALTFTLWFRVVLVLLVTPVGCATAPGITSCIPSIEYPRGLNTDIVGIIASLRSAIA
jgi:hypothetical protein